MDDFPSTVYVICPVQRGEALVGPIYRNLARAEKAWIEMENEEAIAHANDTLSDFMASIEAEASRDLRQAGMWYFETPITTITIRRALRSLNLLTSDGRYISIPNIETLESLRSVPEVNTLLRSPTKRFAIREVVLL